MHTFLFADLVGFTALSIEQGDEQAAECRHALPARGARAGRAPRRDGREVARRRRDGARATTRATRCGSASSSRNGLDGLPPVRVGVNTGPAVERDGDFFGSTVNLAARLSQAARGGEVLLTEATRAAARRRGQRLEERGARTFRNARDPVVVYAASERPPLRDAAARRQAAVRLSAHGGTDQDRLMAIKGLPPRVELPRVVFMTRFMLHPDKLLDRAYRDHGDFFHFVTPLERTMCVTANPETIKQVFRGDPEIFRAGEANAMLGPLVGPHSTLLLDGGEHLRHRKLLLPPFHGERMREYGELMAEVAERHVSAWPKDEPFSAIESTQAITLEVIQRAVFGIEDGRRLDHVGRLLRAVLDPMSNRWQMLTLMLAPSSWGPRSPWGRFRQRVREADSAIYEEIRARRADPGAAERGDVMSLLLQARDEDGEPLSDKELRDELVTLLVAGHETTATSLAWTLERITRHPEVLARLEDDPDGEYLDAVDQGVAAAAPGRAGGGAQAGRAGRARRLRAARGRLRSCRRST